MRLAPLRVMGLALATMLGSSVVGTADAEAKETKRAAPMGPQPWCAPEIEALPNEVCYLDGGRSPERRTLVIFLHGAVARNTQWSWNHERGILRLAKAHNIEIIFPRSPETEPGYVWPGSLEAQEKVEQGLIDGWMATKKALEQRDKRPFDEVFIMGFSSGAYFASSLAMRGRADVDGYAAFAGGSSLGARPNPVHHFAPVFVGVCADDSTAPHSRTFAAALSANGIPRTVNEQPVGHGLSHVHFNYALTYLRYMRKQRSAS